MNEKERKRQRKEKRERKKTKERKKDKKRKRKRNKTVKRKKKKKKYIKKERKERKRKKKKPKRRKKRIFHRSWPRNPSRHPPHAHMMEESVTHIVLGVLVGARLLQTLHHRQVAIVCCLHQRRPAILKADTEHFIGARAGVEYSLIKAFSLLVHICSKTLFSLFAAALVVSFIFLGCFNPYLSYFMRQFLCIRPEV